MSAADIITDPHPGHRAVAVNGGHRDVVVIDRVTPTQIVLTDGRRYRRDTGKGVGNVKGSLAPMTWLVERMAQQAQSDIRHKLGMHRVKTLDRLAAIKAIVAAAEREINELVGPDATDAPRFPAPGSDTPTGDER